MREVMVCIFVLVTIAVSAQFDAACGRASTGSSGESPAGAPEAYVNESGKNDQRGDVVVSAISVREIALLGAALGQIAVRGELHHVAIEAACPRNVSKRSRFHVAHCPRGASAHSGGLSSFARLPGG